MLQAALDVLILLAFGGWALASVCAKWSARRRKQRERLQLTSDQYVAYQSALHAARSARFADLPAALPLTLPVEVPVAPLGPRSRQSGLARYR
jgi:hypothetical protein